MTDPKLYAKPIALTMPMKLLADTEMLEGFCENHHKSRERMTSTKAATLVQVPTSTLSRYVGTYDTVEDDGTKHVVTVTLDGTDPWFNYDGKGKELLMALSPARFSWSGTIVEFSPADAGGMNIVMHYVEGTERGARRK